MARGSEQHGLPTQRHISFAPLQHLGADAFGLHLQVFCGDDRRAYGALPANRQQVLAILAWRFGHDGVRRVQHELGGAIVLGQRHDFRARREALRETQNVVDRRGPERIDGLRIIAHYGEPGAVRTHRVQDLPLQPVRVLVFIHENVVEMRAHVLREARVAHHRVPVEQQVVVVEDVAKLLALDVPAIELGEVRLPLHAPRILQLEGFLERPLGIHAVGVDLHAGFLPRETLLLGRKAQLRTNRIHDVRGVAAIYHGELRIELQVLRVMSQKPVADGVERAGPGQPLRDGVTHAAERFVERHLDDFMGTTAHLGCGTAREREHQDARRVYAMNGEVGHAVREGIGLARAGTRNDEQGAGADAPLIALGNRIAVARGLFLRRVQLFKM